MRATCPCKGVEEEPMPDGVDVQQIKEKYNPKEKQDGFTWFTHHFFYIFVLLTFLACLVSSQAAGR